MQITLNIPDDLTAFLRVAHGNDLGRAALEQLALNGYQTGNLSTYQVQKLLGFTNRFETQNWLGNRGAHESYTLDDLNADRDTLNRLLPS